MHGTVPSVFSVRVSIGADFRQSRQQYSSLSKSTTMVFFWSMGTCGYSGIDLKPALLTSPLFLAALACLKILIYVKSAGANFVDAKHLLQKTANTTNDFPRRMLPVGPPGGASGPRDVLHKQRAAVPASAPPDPSGPPRRDVHGDPVVINDPMMMLAAGPVVIFWFPS